AARCSWVSRSRWTSSSRWSSASARPRRKIERNRCAMIRWSRIASPLGAFDQQADRRRQPLPAAQLALELFAAVAGQRVELGVASQIGLLPFSPNPALLLEPVQRGIQRALADRERVAREELNALGDAPSVERSPGDGFQDQQIERALQEIGRLRHPTPRLSTIIPRLSTIANARAFRRSDAGRGMWQADTAARSRGSIVLSMALRPCSAINSCRP